jgi:hypothetical protein
MTNVYASDRKRINRTIQDVTKPRTNILRDDFLINRQIKSPNYRKSNESFELIQSMKI